MARTVKCPGCGADLTVKDDNRDFMFCEYCGTKVRLDDYQETHRYVDEARIKEAELEMKKLEVEEKKRQDEREDAPRQIKLGLAILVICIVVSILGAKGFLI